MYDEYTFPMEEIEAKAMVDILSHFVGDDSASVVALQNKMTAVKNGYNPAFDSEDAENIVDDLQKALQLAAPDSEVGDFTDYEPTSDAEVSYLEQGVKGFLDFKRKYYEEIMEDSPY